MVKNTPFLILVIKDQKMCVRGMRCNIDTELIIDVLKQYAFFPTHAAIIKSRKTDKPMPLYIVNVLSRKMLDEICNINELCYMRIHS